MCQRAFSSLHIPDAQLQQALDLYGTSISKEKCYLGDLYCFHLITQPPLGKVYLLQIYPLNQLFIET